MRRIGRQIGLGMGDDGNSRANRNANGALCLRINFFLSLQSEIPDLGSG
jgi:hypothetical protein